MNKTINILSKITKGCLIVVALLTIIGAVAVIEICVEVSEGSFISGWAELFASVINTSSFTRAMAIVGFVLAILSLIFSIVGKCSRGVAVVDMIIGGLCFIFGLTLSPICSVEGILSLSTGNIDAEDFGVGVAVILILLIFFSFIRMILNIVAVALKPKAATTPANIAYGYNPQMGYGANGYQQANPQNVYGQGYPQQGYPQNYGYMQNPVQQGYPQNGYPQNMQQSYPQNGFQQNGYTQGMNTYQNVNQNVNGAVVGAAVGSAAIQQAQNIQSAQQQNNPIQVEQKSEEAAKTAVSSGDTAAYSAPEAYVPPVVEAPAAVNANTAGAAAENWNCTNCGAVNEGDSKFCQNCGMQK